MTSIHEPPPYSCAPPTAHPLSDIPRRFYLYRWHDGSGVSGTGAIATGMVWADGRTVTRMLGDTTGVQQISVWDSLDEILRIHGHGGRTEIRWIDPPGPGATDA